jgi:hypothetical protein
MTMKVEEFLLFTFDGSPSTYSAEITSVDPATSLLTCRRLDTGEQFTMQFNMSGVWPGTDSQGTRSSIATHDVYNPIAIDPSPQGVALVTFDDGARYLCSVDSISPQISVVFFHPPYARMSIDGTSIASSDWDAYPAGHAITSIQGCTVDDSVPDAPGVFNDGWWSLARRTPADPGRIGGEIAPFAVVVHTTDMVPESWDALLRQWTTETGPGDCAHFIIGRDADHGIAQLAPVNRNANHAGGPGHGSFVAGEQVWHPNSVAVGIEVHCAGGVQSVDGNWRLIEDGQPQGAPIPDADVIPDPQRPGRGWHRVTDYQYQQLGALLEGLETVLGALPDGCVARSIEQPPPWAIFPTGRRVGHVSLDARNRADPWPPTCDWIRARV